MWSNDRPFLRDLDAALLAQGHVADLHLAEGQLPAAAQLRDLGVPVLPPQTQALHLVPRRIHLHAVRLSCRL